MLALRLVIILGKCPGEAKRSSHYGDFEDTEGILTVVVFTIKNVTSRWDEERRKSDSFTYDYHCIYPVGILGYYVASSFFINDVGTSIDS